MILVFLVMILVVLVTAFGPMTDFGHSGDDFGRSGGIPQCSDQRAKQYENQDHRKLYQSCRDVKIICSSPSYNCPPLTLVYVQSCIVVIIIVFSSAG